MYVTVIYVCDNCFDVTIVYHFVDYVNTHLLGCYKIGGFCNIKIYAALLTDQSTYVIIVSMLQL